MTKQEMVGWHHLLEGDVIWDLVMDRETWRSEVHGVTKIWT